MKIIAQNTRFPRTSDRGCVGLPRAGSTQPQHRPHPVTPLASSTTLTLPVTYGNL
jgi:hypothetical protein